jgi:hypothetical protein
VTEYIAPLHFRSYVIHVNDADVKYQIIDVEDNMRAKKRALVVFKLFGSFLLIILLVACAGKVFTYKGSWVAEDDRISLQAGGPHKGNWQTRDVAIEYAYQQEIQNLQISGVVNLGNYLTSGFRTLDYLTLDIFALDADGIVLDSELVRTFGYRRDMGIFGKMSFNKQMELPTDTAAVAFGYSGRVTEGGGGIRDTRKGDRIDWDFWKVHPREGNSIIHIYKVNSNSGGRL